MIHAFSLHTLALLLLLSSGIGDAREANKAYKEGDYAKAEKLYRAVLENSPNNARIYFNLGNALAKQAKTEEAIQAYLTYKDLAETDEEKALADYNIGTLMAEGEKWKPAAQHFKNALQLNPKDAEAKHNYELAVLNEQKQSNQQQKNQEKDEKEPPSEYAKAMKKKAESLVAEHKYKEAYILMKQALNSDKTVQNYNDFINRILNVSNINAMN